MHFSTALASQPRRSVYEAWFIQRTDRAVVAFSLLWIETWQNGVGTYFADRRWDTVIRGERAGNSVCIEALFERSSCDMQAFFRRHLEAAVLLHLCQARGVDYIDFQKFKRMRQPPVNCADNSPESVGCMRR